MKTAFTWDDVDRLTDRSARLVLDSGFAPDALVGIAKGGWVPARLLASRLKIKCLYSFGLGYANPERTQFDIYSQPSPPLTGLALLVIEDMVESGRMQNAVYDLLSNAGNIVRTVAFFDLPTTLHKPHFVLETLSHVPSFPWERGLDEG